MNIQSEASKPIVEVCVIEAGGFGDVSAGINLAYSLSRNYDILMTFASGEAERKYRMMTSNSRHSFKTGNANAMNDAIARVLPFEDSTVRHLPKKPTIVVSQYNGEPYLYGQADFSVVTGLGIEKDGRYRNAVKPGKAVRSGLYIKDMGLDDIVSRSDVCSGLDKALSKKAWMSPKTVLEAYKEMAGMPLEDSGWVTSYSGTLGIDGIIYDALAEAVSKSESLAKKKPVVLNFIKKSDFIRNTIPACQRNGFNVIHSNEEDGLEVIDRKSPVTVINFDIVDDELYEQAVKKADLMNISAGDGSFSKGFSAFLKTRTPFLKYYNRDQREFMSGLVEMLRDIEAREGSSPVASDLFETFTAHERIYKKACKEHSDTAIECRDSLPIENISRLLYDEQARQEFYNVASQIPQAIKKKREEAGIKAAEVLPNAFETTDYIIAQIKHGKTKDQILKELIGAAFEESLKEDTNPGSRNRLLHKLKIFGDNLESGLESLTYHIDCCFDRVFCYTSRMLARLHLT